MGVNSLPKAVTRQHCGCDLNPGLSVPESSTLTTGCIVQLMPLPSQIPIIFCLIYVQTGFTFLVSAYPGCPGKDTIKRFM